MRRVLALICVLTAALRADCGLDTSFGAGGVALFSATPYSATGNDFMVLSDGRLLVAGAKSSPISPLWWGTDSLGNQVATGALPMVPGATDEVLDAVAQSASGGSVYLGGLAWGGSLTYTVVAKLNFPALTLDSSFGTGGFITRTSVAANNVGIGLAVDATGLIYLADGNELWRFQSNGAVDTSFASSGKFIFDASALALDLKIDGQGRLIVVGSVPTGNGLWRILSNGSLDSSFGGTGKAVMAVSATQSGWATVAVEAGDGLLVSGHFNSYPQSGYVVGRYSAAGSPLLQAQGAAVSNSFADVEAGGILPDSVNGGVLLLGAYPSSFYDYPSQWKLLADGSPDTSFGSGGRGSLSAIQGVVVRGRPRGSDGGFASGWLGANMALWKFKGCSSAATTPVLPSGASADKPVAFPQPAKDKLTIAFTMPEAGQVQLQVFDESGRSGAGVVKGFGAGTANWILDVSGYSPGVYLYVLKLDLPSGSRRLGPAKFAVKP